MLKYCQSYLTKLVREVLSDVYNSKYTGGEYWVPLVTLLI